jgi:LmbE family N-acetylglucosaminyl deacetylase
VRLLVFSAHTADFCSRAGGTIALHAKAGAAVKRDGHLAL